MKLTPWFDGNVKPVRPGVYERKYPNNPHRSYCLWTGEEWFLWQLTAVKAEVIKDFPSLAQELPWRGILK